MKLYIQTTASCDREQLRTLLIDSADELAGKQSSVLEAKLPWDGHPMLLADALGHPILVSFELENSQAALVNGLVAIEQLTAALPWINQVYTPLGEQQRLPRLVLVSPESPPGSTAILASCPNLSLFSYRILSINGDTGLLLERLSGYPLPEATQPEQNRASSAPVQAVVETGTSNGDSTPPALSNEERAYFQQL